jgi:hypothetical protein
VKLVPVEQAVGMVLCHDMTRIVPGESKGPAFRKGHVVRAEEIPLLLSMGKEHIYVWEIEPGRLHEEEAALRLARANALTGSFTWGEPKEGKVDLKAAYPGLFRVDLARLDALNAIGEIQMATIFDKTPVAEGKTCAATRVTPLFIDEHQILDAERLGPFLEVKPFRPLKGAVIVTGSEVYKGRIEDRFGPVVEQKLSAYGCPVVYRSKSLDDPAMIAAKIAEARAAGAEIILCTGGMSVDPDDATPGGIRRSGAQVVKYGTPVLPGSMLLFAYLDGTVPVMGLPGSVMYDKVTIFDHILPRCLAGELLTEQDFVAMGHGGLLHHR